MRYQILNGNCYDLLKNLLNDPKELGKYRLIVTSHPYYGHRHNGMNPNKIGQEPTDDIFIDRLTDIIAICRELLAEDGSLWIIIGDTRQRFRKLLIPHRFALNLSQRKYTIRRYNLDQEFV